MTARGARRIQGGAPLPPPPQSLATLEKPRAIAEPAGNRLNSFACMVLHYLAC